MPPSIRQSKQFAFLFRKPITITAERLSDKSRITFTISSDKSIEQLRALLNHHLPPLSSDKFDLYSYQRGALIHFHPSSFRLDYFPVIFDQSVLLLKMDDRLTNSDLQPSPKHNQKQSRNRCSIWTDFFSSRSTTTTATTRKSPELSSSSPITCLSILKQVFRQPSSTVAHTLDETTMLTYWKKNVKDVWRWNCSFQWELRVLSHVLFSCYYLVFLYLPQKCCNMSVFMYRNLTDSNKDVRKEREKRPCSTNRNALCLFN